jgi:hypothetical protein
MDSLYTIIVQITQYNYKTSLTELSDEKRRSVNTCTYRDHGPEIVVGGEVNYLVMVPIHFERLHLPQQWWTHWTGFKKIVDLFHSNKKHEKSSQMYTSH